MTLWVWGAPWVSHLWCPGSVVPDRDRRWACAAGVSRQMSANGSRQMSAGVSRQISANVSRQVSAADVSRQMAANGSQCRNISGYVRKCQTYQGMSGHVMKCHEISGIFQEYIRKCQVSVRNLREYIRKMSGLCQERQKSFKKGWLGNSWKYLELWGYDICIY